MFRMIFQQFLHVENQNIGKLYKLLQNFPFNFDILKKKILVL
jgi:hypothetical protein